MAHVVRINELSGALVTRITGKGGDSSSFSSLRDKVVKGLREHGYARTNQFDVRDRYAGLVKKFAILNREDLADALQQRLQALPAESRWLPEVLSLFLQLSDRPADKTDLLDLHISPGVESVPQGLTWAQVLADDPLVEDGLWEDVERGYHSSSDEAMAVEDIENEPTTSTQATSVDGDDFAEIARAHVVLPHETSLPLPCSARDQLLRFSDSESSMPLSDLVVIRETFAMLRALPTNLYFTNSSTMTITVNKQVALASATKISTHALLEELAHIGTELNLLRRWCSSEQKAVHTQAMQAALQVVLKRFASAIDEAELHYVQPRACNVVSIVKVHAEVQQLAIAALRLSRLVRSSASAEATSLQLIDALYEDACSAQLSDDHTVFETLTDVLLSGISAYLCPIHDWIETGSLPSKEREIFFVERKSADCELGTTWHNEFALRASDSNRVLVPSFMQKFSDQILSMGKTKAFWKRLDRGNDDIPLGREDSRKLPDLKHILTDIHNHPFLSFPLLLDNELRSWLGSRSHDVDGLVRSKLLYEHDFNAVLRALEYVYFGRDGTLFQNFADTIFERMKVTGVPWRDHFMLTELAQDTIGAAPPVEEANLSVRCLQEHGNAHPALSQVRQLQTVELDYVFPSAARNITSCATSIVHSKAFTLLLQLYRAKSLLRSRVFALRSLNCRDSSETGPTKAALKLSQRLLWFVDTMHAHIGGAASQSHSLMHGRMKVANGVDAMTAIWADYIKRLEINLLIAPDLSPIGDAVTDTLELCEAFGYAWRPAGGDAEGASEIARDSKGEANGRLARMLCEFEKSLSFVVAGLRGISRAGDEKALEALAERLDWNGG